MHGCFVDCIGTINLEAMFFRTLYMEINVRISYFIYRFWTRDLP
jgi:hypothetical protein